jgi:MFS family permease
MNDPYYNIALALPDFDENAYGIYSGLMYSVTFVPALLFVGPLSGNWNRKLTVGVSSIGWGLCIFLHAYAQNKYHLFILFALVGLFQSIGNTLTYVLITEYFEPKARVRAFFIFSILT